MMRKLKRVARELTPPVMWRTVAWLLRFHGAKSIWVDVRGVKLFLPSSHPLPTFVANFEHYDKALPSFMRWLCDQSTERILLIDVGANVGDTAALVAAATGQHRVSFLCVEPDVEAIPYLRTNTQDLEVEIIAAIVGAASSDCGPLGIKRYRDGTAATMESATGNRILSLDDLLCDRAPDVLKIDTDGYDGHVLRGALRCLQRHRPHIFLEYSPYHLRTYGQDDPSLVVSLLRDVGYSSAIVYDNRGHPIGVFRLGQAELEMVLHYVDIRSGMYADLLVSCDAEMLTRFYELEKQRFSSQPPF
jgi:FkbM family methyltransferase